MPLGLIAGAIGSLVGAYRASKGAQAVTSVAAPAAIGAAGYVAGQGSMRAAPATPSGVPGAPTNAAASGRLRARWDAKQGDWVLYVSRRGRKRAMTASQREAIAFLKGMGLSAEKAATLVMAGVGK